MIDFKTKKWLKQQQLKRPHVLKKGSTVGVVAFSDRMTRRDIKDLRQSIEVLEEWGLKVIVSKHVTGYLLEKNLPLPNMVISEMMTLARNDVDAFYSAKGGFAANRLFHYQDFEKLLRIIVRKKIAVLGYSDATTIQVPLVYHNLASYYAPNLTHLHRRGTETLNSLYQAVFSQTRPFQKINNFFFWQNVPPQKIKGVLITGNLVTMHDCIAGDYNLLTKFPEIILAVEEVDESLENLERLLGTMTSYSSVKALIINFKKRGEDYTRKQLIPMIRRLAGNEIPVLWYPSFGHIVGKKFFRTLGSGWPAQLTLKKSKTAELEFLPLS
ncbi:LD-carboxypeptidase [Candidatus Microgenomates bacterium]|nr:LD-carboxypeptidase [Candidatus Microgenomates bacterium]